MSAPARVFRVYLGASEITASYPAICSGAASGRYSEKKSMATPGTFRNASSPMSPRVSSPDEVRKSRVNPTRNLFIVHSSRLTPVAPTGPDASKSFPQLGRKLPIFTVADRGPALNRRAESGKRGPVVCAALGSVFDGVAPHVYQNCFQLSMVFRSHRSGRIPEPQ